MHHDDEVREIAYGIWEEEGHPNGREWEHWFKAEAMWQERQRQMEHLADDLLSRTDIVTPGAGAGGAKRLPKQPRRHKR